MNQALVVAALRAELAELQPRAARHGRSQSEAWNVLVVVVLRELLTSLADARGHDPALLQSGRLFRSVPAFQADERWRWREMLAAELRAPELPELARALRELPGV